MEGDDEMKLYKLNFILVMMLILTSKILSSTLAMNVTEVSASDTALIYKWNFNVDNDTKNFDFGLLDNNVTRFARGRKSFMFSNGGSDVDIDYSVKMTMTDLLEDINSSKSGNQYVPLIFRISSEDAEVSDKCNTWFTPEDLYDGETEDEVKIIEDGRFKKVINPDDETKAVPLFTQKEDALLFAKTDKCRVVCLKYKDFASSRAAELTGFDGVVINPGADSIFFKLSHPLLG